MTFSKSISILSAATIALGTAAPALATPPDVGGQSGAGSTEMTMVWQNADQEYGGTEDPNNPNPTGNPGDDGYDPTAPGENLAFKAPTAINFVAKANGELLAPSAGSIHIDNYSAFGIHVSSMKIDENTADGWNIVEDAAAASGVSNAVWGSIGPSGDALNWARHVPVAPSTDPIPVTDPASWNMASYDGETSTGDQVALGAVGNVANLNLDLSTAKTFGTIHWYLKKGNAEAASSIPTNLSNASLTDLVNLSSGLKAGTVSTSEVTSLLGQTTSVVLGNNTSATVRLVDASQARGLTFMFDAPITEAPLNVRQGEDSDNYTNGWRDCDMRASLNTGGELYNSLLKDMTLGGTTVTPVLTHLSSVYNPTYAENGTDRGVLIETDDLFWLPSVVELYGAWGEYYTEFYNGNEGCTQFAYYNSLGVTPDNCGALNTPGYSYKATRSAGDSHKGSVMGVSCSDNPEWGGIMDDDLVSDADSGIQPCFCI